MHSKVYKGGCRAREVSDRKQEMRIMTPRRSVLQASGIEIEANPEDISKLPDYVEALRRHLLNFQVIIPSVSVSSERSSQCTVSLTVSILGDR